MLFSPHELAVGLVALYRNAASPPYREMVQRAGGDHTLALSSISRIVNRRALPVTERQMAAFLQGCGVRPGTKQHDAWLAAWSRTKTVSYVVRRSLSPSWGGVHGVGLFRTGCGRSPSR